MVAVAVAQATLATLEATGYLGDPVALDAHERLRRAGRVGGEARVGLCGPEGRGRLDRLDLRQAVRVHLCALVRLRCEGECGDGERKHADRVGTTVMTKHFGRAREN